jgi:hypothetical protein
MTGSVQNLAGSAASGGWAVSEQGGQALIQAIDNIVKGLDSAEGDLHSINQQPKLGTSPGANVTKPFVHQVASSGQDSFISALDTLKSSLSTARSAINTAMRNYQETDAAQRSALLKTEQ